MVQDSGQDVSPRPQAARFLAGMWRALGGDPALAGGVTITVSDDLPSAFAVSDLAAASIGAAGLAVAEYLEASTGRRPEVAVDRRLASLWFATSIAPVGWDLPPTWHPLAGDYPGRDGWIRLHTNAPRHAEASLAALGCSPDREAVAGAVARWPVHELEAAVVAAGGCAAAMRSIEAWARHPQGRSVASEPLLWRERTAGGRVPAGQVDARRPLAGVRVLDLTRILAGPVATRFLAGLGAEVLRIDPPDWSEPALEPEVTLGKRCARLDLKAPVGREALLVLLAGADVLVHGYRPGALDGLGLGADVRARVRPGLIDVSLDAYGWTGPWAGRRGFDSLVQMSAGLAEAGMRQAGADRPRPLPVQALDHATGYLLAAAAVRGLTERCADGAGTSARASLARTSALLARGGIGPVDGALGAHDAADLLPAEERTAWGAARRLRPPVRWTGCGMAWDRPAAPLGSAEPGWGG